MTRPALSRLLLEPCEEDYSVALRRGEPIGFRRFKLDVQDAAARFKSHRRAALVCHDSYNFVVGLYGLLHAGTTIVFPPNGQSGTLLSLKNEFDFLVDDAVVQQNTGKIGELNSIDASESQLIFLTSGSTAAPKKIIKQLAMLEREIAVLDSLWGSLFGSGAVFSTVSHQHIYGMTFKLLWPLMAGRPFSAEMYVLWEDLFSALTPGASIISSPAHLERLDGILPVSKKMQPKQIFSAGAPLSLRSGLQVGQVLGCVPTEIFGSTETGAIATRQQRCENEPWNLLPGIGIRCDEGHLSVYTPFVGDGWIDTSDLVNPTDGGFYFLGRADRIAKIEGKRISLLQVEDSLEQLPFVAEAAVTVLSGLPHCLGAAIVLSDEGTRSLEALGNFRFGRLLRSSLLATQEAAGIPRQWRFLNELPTKGMGKRRNADILALFEVAS